MNDPNIFENPQLVLRRKLNVFGKEDDDE